ncbi:MAG TPA: TetR/AcrR family transcriptional regulator C-terminal domain-containing protein [Acidimicrobiales bacterium]|nr:TetR/AcrR family transcriptional regulator C-terminal domain-containing protein [Acidimicrobiales bacterium]
MSRTQVVNAAIDVVSAGGYEQMTIRSLAARLGVAPMSLYRHVRDKDDLLDEVVDRLLSHAWRPRASRNNWRAWVGEACEKLRAFLVAQPAAMHVFLTHPVVSPAAVERMEAVMSVLRSAGFDEPSAKRAYAAIHTYTLGFSALEAGRVGWAPADGRVSALAKQLAAYTTPRQFGEGLNYLLDGIARSAGVAEATGKPPRRKGS